LDLCDGDFWNRAGAEFAIVRGCTNPRSQKRDLHPTNEDPFVGTPDLGHPA